MVVGKGERKHPVDGGPLCRLLRAPSRWDEGSVRARSLLLIVLAVGCGSSVFTPLRKVPTRWTGEAALFAASPEFNVPDENGKIPCTELLRSLEKSSAPAIAVLWGTAGEDSTCIWRFAEHFRDRPHLIRIYLFNLTWMDGDGEWFPGDLYRGFTGHTLSQAFRSRDAGVIAALTQRASDVANALASVSSENTEFRFTLALEDVLDPDAANIAAKIAEGILLQNVDLNPLVSSTSTGDRVKEVHGASASCSGQAQVASLDGSHLEFEEMLAWLKQTHDCKEQYLWIYKHQGLCLENGRVRRCVKDPRARKLSFSEADQLAEIYLWGA